MMSKSTDSQSWIQAWKEGRTAFHKRDYHEKLLQYFPRLNPQKGAKVFVPLCGKSKDLLWLRSLGLEVHGIELYEGAVRAFFEENQLPAPDISKDGPFVCYSSEGIYLRCGDFFEMRETEAYDFVYDRAALVAIQPDRRSQYAETIGRCLKKGGRYLLVAYDYDPSQMEGPPFHVKESEINALYGNRFSIHFLESEEPSNEAPRLSAVESLRQTVYLLER